MTGTDDLPRLLLVVVCCLALTAGTIGGDPAVVPTEQAATPPAAAAAPATATVPADGTAQLDGLFERPGDTVGEPDLAVALADPVVEPGTETTVDLTIVNTGRIERGAELDEPTATARGVTVTVDDEDAPVEVSTVETAIGSIPPGESVTVPVRVTAPASADGDEGELEVDLEYTFTEIDDDGTADDESESDEFDVDIEVGERSRFEIEDAETDAQVGTDGTVDVELENVGEADAENVRVTARSPTGGVTIGAGSGGGTATGSDTPQQPDGNGGSNASLNERADMSTESAAFLGELDEGDDETVSFDSRIDPDLSVESYLLEVTVVYEDEDGILRESATLATAVEPTGAQTFELDGVDSTLEVGESGTITATLENTGPESVETPVVRAEPASDRIDIGENQVAVADLDENETANVSFDADVSGQADPGPRPVTFTVEYGVDDERLDSDPFVRRVPVRDEQSAFTVTAPDAEIPAGTTETVRLNVTNNRGERLSNINVFLFPDGPLAVDSDEAFISELEPGESETVAVEVTVDETASQREYPLEVDFRYDTETDDDLISQVYQVPITAAEPPEDDGLLPSLVSLFGVVALLVGGAVVIRRRR
jgi:hypothetical protein